MDEELIAAVLQSGASEEQIAELLRQIQEQQGIELQGPTQEGGPLTRAVMNITQGVRANKARAQRKAMEGELKEARKTREAGVSEYLDALLGRRLEPIQVGVPRVAVNPADVSAQQKVLAQPAPRPTPAPAPAAPAASAPAAPAPAPIASAAPAVPPPAPALPPRRLSPGGTRGGRGRGADEPIDPALLAEILRLGGVNTGGATGSF